MSKDLGPAGASGGPAAASARRKAVAHHEAGHAVAAFYFDHAIESVTIKPGEDFAGSSISSPDFGRGFDPEVDVDAAQYVKMLEDIVVCFAGHEAEAAYRGRRNWHGSTTDFGIAADLALYLSRGSEEASALLRWRKLVARGLVKAHTREIAAVASALLAQGTLAGDDVRETIRIALGIPALEELPSPSGGTTQ